MKRRARGNTSTRIFRSTKTSTFRTSRSRFACSAFHLRPFTKQPTGRAVGLRPTVLCLPYLMSPHQQSFDRFAVLAGAQFLVTQAVLDVECGVEIGVCAVATDLTAKRLLVGSVGS